MPVTTTFYKISEKKPEHQMISYYEEDGGLI